MEHSSTLIYTYSAAQNQEVQAIRRKYLPETKSELEKLKELDAKVSRPANVAACTVGTIGSIIMGAGMSLVMTDIGAKLRIAAPMVPGIAIGLVGLTMLLLAYPVYRCILKRRKRKYAEQILQISESIMQKQKEIK